MAVYLLNFQPNTRPICPHIKALPIFRPRINTRFQFQYPVTIPSTRKICFFNSNLTSLSNFSAPSTPRGGGKEDEDIELVDILKEWLSFMQSALPGGSWWNLYDSKEVESSGTAAKPFTVLNALRRLWILVEDDRWVIYVAFSSLTISAVSMLVSVFIVMLSIVITIDLSSFVCIQLTWCKVSHLFLRKTFIYLFAFRRLLWQWSDRNCFSDQLTSSGVNQYQLKMFYHCQSIYVYFFFPYCSFQKSQYQIYWQHLSFRQRAVKLWCFIETRTSWPCCVSHQEYAGWIFVLLNLFYHFYFLHMHFPQRLLRLDIWWWK